MARQLLIFLLSACALALQAQERTAPEPAGAQAAAIERVTRNWHLRIGVALAESGRPRDLALAALLHDLAGGSGDQAAAWRRRATAAAGADVAANALLAAGPDTADTAQREQAARRWASAEPDNIAPLLFAEGGVEELLAGAGAMRRFDLHMYDQVRWIQAALLQHPPTGSERAVLFGGQDVSLEEYAAVSAMGLWAAGSIPPLEELLQACDPADQRAGPARREACGRIARTLTGHSDSNLGRMAGIDMLAQLAVSAGERAEAQALRRHMDWQMLEWGRIVAGQARGGAPQFARLLRDPAVRTERDLVERVLGEAGVAADPPPAWQSPRR